MRVESLALYLSLEPLCSTSGGDEHHRVEYWAALILHQFCPRLKSFTIHQIVIRDVREETILRDGTSPENCFDGRY